MKILHIKTRLYQQTIEHKSGTIVGSAHHSSMLTDNTLALAFVRRGGHLAVLHALKHFPTLEEVQALGLSLLVWLCEQRCNVKASLVERGAVSCTLFALRKFLSYDSSYGSSFLVVTECLYLMGHLAKIPKVAQQILASDSLDVVARTLFRAIRVTSATRSDANLARSVLFWMQQLLTHGFVRMADWLEDLGAEVWAIEQLRWDVNRMGDDPHHPDSDELVPTILMACDVLRHFVSTPSATEDRRQRLVSAGALTAVAQVVRLVSLSKDEGSEKHDAPGLCLRALVPR